MAEDCVTTPDSVMTGLVAVHTMALTFSPSRGRLGVKTQLPVAEEGWHVTNVQLMPGAGLALVTKQVRLSSLRPSVMKVEGPMMVVLSSKGPSGKTSKGVPGSVQTQANTHPHTYACMHTHTHKHT